MGPPGWLLGVVAVVAIAMLSSSALSAVGVSHPSPLAPQALGSSGALAELQAAPRLPVSALSHAPANAAYSGSYSGSTSVFVTFALSNATALDQLLSELQNPKSPQYHHYLTQAQFVGAFAPSAQAYSAAITYFDSFSGIQLTTYQDRIGLHLSGPASSMGAAFGVSLGSFRAPVRGAYYAPLGAPTLPAPIAHAVVQVEGLSSYLDAQTMLSGLAPLSGAKLVPSFSNGYPSPLDCGGYQCLYGSDLQVAYDEQTLLQITFPTNEQVATILWAGCNAPLPPSGVCPTANLTGSYDPNDVYTYYNDTVPAGQPHASVVGVPFDGAPPPGISATYDVTGAVFENTLDVAMAGSTAPGSTIYNVYGVSSLDPETDAAMAYVLNNLTQVNVVSNSWGGQDHVDSAWNSYMQEAASRGVTVLASSGDSGDSPTSSRYVGSTTEFPSSVGYDTYGVVAVGGTTLTVNPNSFPTTSYLHILSETTWYNGNYNGDQIGSSGGVSTSYPEPSWQVATEANAVIQGAGQGSHRGVPDIAAIANNTVLYMTTNGGAPQVYYAWGTSIASPLTAGMMAEIDAILAHYSTPTLGFVDPGLYAWGNNMNLPFVNTSSTGYLFTGPWGTPLPSPPMNDILTGGNFLYPALKGYDLVTGWGSLDAYNFTIYIYNENYSGANFSLSGVRSVLTMNGLNVTSPGVPYNASVQQNFVLANSLGAPLYWVQNVIYIAGSPEQGWQVNYTGWVIFPFFGIYPGATVYEYNFPVTGTIITTPITWTIQSWLTGSAGMSTMNFAINGQTLQLPVPGAQYIIGGYHYRYYWQGSEYTNGPFPNNTYNGGLAPQLGLVGGPSLGQGYFLPPTSGSLASSVEMTGSSGFSPTPFASVFNEYVDQTGELAENLMWTGSGSTWGVSAQPGATDQGVVSYTTLDAGNPATYSVATYALTFTESGLPNGASWSVALKGVPESCTVGSPGGPCGSDTMVFEMPNGMYSFAASAVGYSANPSSGSVTVSGGPIAQTIVFQAAVDYAVSFTESGLTGGAQWTVTLGGIPRSSSSAVISFVEPNGNYPFTVSATGYNASPPSGTIVVAGMSVNQSISFTQGGGGGGGGGTPAFSLFGLSGLNLLIFLAVIIIIVVTVAAVAASRSRHRPPPAPGLPPGGPPAAVPPTPPYVAGPPPPGPPSTYVPPPSPPTEPAWTPPPSPPPAPYSPPPPTYTPPPPSPPPAPAPAAPPPAAPVYPPSSAGPAYAAAPPVRRCPRCGSLAPFENRFCRVCGSPLT